jgi:hypothetical protein
MRVRFHIIHIYIEREGGREGGREGERERGRGGEGGGGTHKPIGFARRCRATRDAAEIPSDRMGPTQRIDDVLGQAAGHSSSACTWHGAQCSGTATLGRALSPPEMTLLHVYWHSAASRPQSRKSSAGASRQTRSWSKRAPSFLVRALPSQRSLLPSRRYESAEWPSHHSMSAFRVGIPSQRSLLACCWPGRFESAAWVRFRAKCQVHAEFITRHWALSARAETSGAQRARDIWRGDRKAIWGEISAEERNAGG